MVEINEKLEKFNTSLRTSKDIAKMVLDNGGRAYFVGGYVRDKLLKKHYDFNKSSYDIDIEVHGIDTDILEKILYTISDYKYIGKSFGIYSLSSLNIDIALPRKETLIGERHNDFDVEINPHIGTREASRRRDFTINSIMQDILTGEFIDHYNGIEDIKNKIIRHVDNDKFSEDALRVLRACQFAARFKFKIAESTIDLCKTISLDKLSKERVLEETKKTLLLSDKPSVYFNNLYSMNQIQWYKELYELKDIQQNPVYHAEGNVYIHTMMVLDVGAALRNKANEKLNFMFSLLCHDLGKAKSTLIKNGKITSIGHEEVGVDIADKFLRRITDNKKLIKYVKNMVLLHMKPNMYAAHNSKIKSTNKLFFKSVSPEDLILLAIADSRGRTSTVNVEDNSKYLFERLEIYKEYISRDYLNGNDLIKLGIKPNEKFSLLIDHINKLRLSGVNKKEQISQVLAYNKQLNNE